MYEQTSFVFVAFVAFLTNPCDATFQIVQNQQQTFNKNWKDLRQAKLLSDHFFETEIAPREDRAQKYQLMGIDFVSPTRENPGGQVVEEFAEELVA